ncbi:MAG TPA: G1 family glutamic endopeptidase [Acidimicrobiales bacterium]
MGTAPSTTFGRRRRLRWWVPPPLVVAALVAGWAGPVVAATRTSPASLAPSAYHLATFAPHLPRAFLGSGVGTRRVTTVAGPGLLGPGPLHHAGGLVPRTGSTPLVPSPSSRLAPHLSLSSGHLFSTNWSGEVLTGSTYSGVSAQWDVPAVGAIINDEYSATWVGIDGTRSSSLIQAGTAQNAAGGVSTYFAWVELLPNMAMPINGTVAPGDSMAVAIVETSTNVWEVQVTDTSQNWTYQHSFNYATPGTSAEWIEEAPTVNGAQSALAAYVQVPITNVAASAASLPDSVLTPIFMVDPQFTGIISWPSPYDQGTDAFTMSYGSPTPVITSVDPSGGSSQGSTLVLLDGQYLFAASTATFGRTPSQVYVDDADGTVMTAAPPGSPGTVDVILASGTTSSHPTPADRYTYSSSIPPPPHGYWLVGADGGIFTFGSAQFYGSAGNLSLQRPVTGIDPTSDQNGYWLVATDGGIFAFGDAGFHGSIPGLGIAPAGTIGAPRVLNAPIVGMVPSVHRRGYFLVAADGGVFAFGDATFSGSCPGIGGCAGSAVAVMPDSSGQGYWLVTDSGNVYAFGDAPYYGGASFPGPFTITSAVRTPDGGGYWLLYADGRVEPVGDARYFGYASPYLLSADASAIFATRTGFGYWVADQSGGVYNFGDAPYDGSMIGHVLNAPVIAATGW